MRHRTLWYESPLQVIQKDVGHTQQPPTASSCLHLEAMSSLSSLTYRAENKKVLSLNWKNLESRGGNSKEDQGSYKESSRGNSDARGICIHALPP